MKRRPWLLLGPVFLYVRLRGFLGVVRRMKRVAVGDMRVMRCLLVVPLIVMCRCFFVVTSSMLVMFGCLTVMFSRFLGHVQPPFSSSCLYISLPRKVSMKPVSVEASTRSGCCRCWFEKRWSATTGALELGIWPANQLVLIAAG
jgi:hypothetical protein